MAGTRETLGDTLILFAALAFGMGMMGRQDPVLLASAPLLICGILLRRGRPTASLFHIPIRLPVLPPVVLAPTIALVVVAARWLVLR